MSLSDPIPTSSPFSPFNFADHGAQDTVIPRHSEGDLKLHEVLSSLTPLPKHTLFLGLCEDGLPLLMDLRNPAPGSVLILGDQARSNKNLIKAMLASVLFYDPRLDLQIDLVTPRPEAFVDFSLLDGLVISSPFDNTFPELIWHLTRCAYQHGNGGRGQVVRVLLIDDLLATGGTALAAAALIEKVGGVVSEMSFIVNLPDVGGEKKLLDKGYKIYSLTEFEGE